MSQLRSYKYIHLHPKTGFKANKPLLCCKSKPEGRGMGITPKYGVNWTAGDDGVEIIGEP